ncbi:MAG: hypothetical protein ACD_5C00302G0001 [uncultured bacterium]|nr:MAG: hypothetical protein ACD_5C00302G0001 [uncultured bacterium]KKQ60310.1 MAG: peptidyl-tRNA hydrolase [Parcubacteria group bacterium GW2011_GWC1_38_22]
MKLIVGLGNPGNQYQNTRHNVGFIILDELAKTWKFPQFQASKKFNAEISESLLNSEKIILVKPQTFMNQSGQSVKALIDFYKLSIEDFTVIHDDLDIDLGAFKISTDCSAGGHNGIQSIIENIGTQKFKRIRIGIEGAEKKKERLMSGSDFVLQKFSDEEIEIVKKLGKEIAENL